MKKFKYQAALIFICISTLSLKASVNEILTQVEHGVVDNNGVKIHYAALGEGPLVVMVHGYPDFWYTWRDQMAALSKQFHVVAIDLRGYNKSDKPKGVENYTMRALIGDVAAVIQHFEQEKAVLVGHDWGGAIAWQVAMWRPDLVEKLVVLSTPHPNGLFREMANNPDQQKNSQYARDFQKVDAHKSLTAEGLAGWVQDENAKEHYIEAFRRSDFEAMLNYYKANFPSSSSSNQSASGTPTAPATLRKVKCPTLVIFGLQDKALLPAGFNETWQWIEKDLTMVALPEAGHFIQKEASEMVTRSMTMWLNR